MSSCFLYILFYLIIPIKSMDNTSLSLVPTNDSDVFSKFPDLDSFSTEGLVAPFVDDVLSSPVANEEAGEKIQAVELVDKNKDKKHVCSWPKCTYATARKIDLNRHINSVHKGIKLHECPELGCTYASSEKGRLQIHINGVHKGIKLHECPECEYAASYRSNLQKHINSMHKGIKLYECLECKHAASDRSKLQKHIDSVHKLKRDHICSYCFKGLSQKFGLLSHLISLHRKEDNFANAFKEAGGNLAKIKVCICGYQCWMKGDYEKHIKCCKKISVGQKRGRDE